LRTINAIEVNRHTNAIVRIEMSTKSSSGGIMFQISAALAMAATRKNITEASRIKSFLHHSAAEDMEPFLCVNNHSSA